MSPLLIDLVLIGFGHVGRRFGRLLAERAQVLARDDGLITRVVGVATARHGRCVHGRGLDVERALELAEHGRSIAPLGESGVRAPTSAEEMLDWAVSRPRAGPVVVVETTPLDIDAGQPATGHVRMALERGAHVITANKGPVAFAYRELHAEASARRREFLFEGTVMDGVPVFNLVRETLPAVRVTGFRGVVNSTTNHILTAMEAGREFDAALADMQRAGITEADPSLDVDGWDAAAKTAALMNVFMDAGVTPRDIVRTGIGHLTRRDVTAAAARGRRVRLVASAGLEGGRVRGTVAPAELPPDDVLGSLRGQSNALILETDLLGALAITQIDASLTHTAYALLSDLVTVRRRV